MNANLELSKKENELIVNSDFILTKNRIIEKVYAFYGVMSEEYKNLLDQHSSYLPDEIFTIPPKIYKGEQYKNLPYVMLDYPRYFSKTNVFAIRSFFWWGNFFSITLQISGTYLEKFADNIFHFISNEKNSDWFFGIKESQWEHDFEKNNYMHFNDLNTLDAATFKSRQFIKIATKLSLEDWKIADEFYLKHYTKLLKILCA